MQISVEWDGRAIRQAFGACNIVADGVATLADGRRFRINASANRAARQPAVTLRYMTEAKRGAEVRETALPEVRAAALASFAELLAPLRAEFIAKARAADAAYMAERNAEFAAELEAPAAPLASDAEESAIREARADEFAAELEAPGATLVANTTRACYWRTVDGHFIATRADDPRPAANAPGYRELEAIMRLKGESSDTIAKLAPPAMLEACSPYARRVVALPPYRIAAELDRLQRLIASLRAGKES